MIGTRVLDDEVSMFQGCYQRRPAKCRMLRCWIRRKEPLSRSISLLTRAPPCTHQANTRFFNPSRVNEASPFQSDASSFLQRCGRS